MVASRKGNATRRRSSIKPLSARSLTIPELKHSFDSLENGVHKLLKDGGNQAEQTKKFQILWKTIFHKPVSKSAAESYLHIKRLAGTRPVHRSTRKMKGGAGALAGAPLDHMTGPGVDAVYGSFPAYQTQGLTFYNTVNQAGIAQECGTKDFTPAVPEMIGSNEPLKGGGKKSQRAGGIGDLAHLMSAKPIQETSPPGTLQDLQQFWQGKPLGASPAPEQSHLVKL